MMKSRKLRKLLMVFSFIAVLSMLAVMAPVTVAAANPPVTTINYSFYATDGYWTMADGTQLYAYGFVGGRTGETITYLDTKWDAPIPNAPLTVTVPAATPGSTLSAGEQALQGHAQFPGPLIFAGVGDTVTITLKNLGVTNPGAVANDPHTIHLHGLDVDVANDGVPETSVTAIAANDPTQAAIGAGNVVVYKFVAKTAGSYFYHCHQEADIHVTMGMMGALIVYNRADTAIQNNPAITDAIDPVEKRYGPGYPGSLFGFSYAKDVVMFMNDTDANQHFSEGSVNGAALPTSNGAFQDFSGPVTLPNVPPAPNAAGSFNPIKYQPQYWFVNMLSFPQTVHASDPAVNFNYSDWIAAHPGYEPMITGSVSAKDKVLVRMTNMGFETQPLHMHGFHAKVIGKDQRAWTWANNPLTPVGQGLEANTITIGSGEEYDLLFNFGTVAVTSTYEVGTQTKYDANGAPISNTQTGSTIVGPGGYEYIPGPTVNGVGDMVPPTNALGYNNLKSQVYVFHNHDDYKATNNGTYPGGQFTVLVPLP